jgi:hypothetical protein
VSLWVFFFQIIRPVSANGPIMLEDSPLHYPVLDHENNDQLETVSGGHFYNHMHICMGEINEYRSFQSAERSVSSAGQPVESLEHSASLRDHFACPILGTLSFLKARINEQTTL